MNASSKITRINQNITERIQGANIALTMSGDQEKIGHAKDQSVAMYIDVSGDLPDRVFYAVRRDLSERVDCRGVERSGDDV